MTDEGAFMACIEAPLIKGLTPEATGKAKLNKNNNTLGGLAAGALSTFANSPVI